MKKIIMDKIGTIISIVVVIILAILYYNSVQERDLLEKMNKQNLLALNDTLKTIVSEKDSIQHRFVSVQEINESEEKIIEDLKEEVLSLTKQNIKLKDINSKGTGVITKTDTIKINDCKGLNMIFTDSNKFYNWKMDVTVNNPPTYTFDQKFNSFGQKIYLTRNDKGIWSGYSKLDDWVQKYISLNNFEVIVEKDEFYGIEKEEFELLFIPKFSVRLQPDVFLNGGLNVLINDKYLIGYEKGIADDFYQFNFGYAFRLF